MKLKYILVLSSGVIIPALFFLSSQDFIDEDAKSYALPSNNESAIQKFAAKEGSLMRDTRIDGMKTSITNLEREIVTLRSEMSALRSVMNARSATTSDANISASANSVAIDPVKELQLRNETKAKEEQQLQNQIEQLDIGFRQQTIDPEWSTKAKSMIENALTSDKVPSKDIIGIECRATMCRLELANDDNQEAPKISQFSMLIGEELPSVRVNQSEEADGTTTTVMYLSKDDDSPTDKGG